MEQAAAIEKDPAPVGAVRDLQRATRTRRRLTGGEGKSLDLVGESLLQLQDAKAVRRLVNELPPAFVAANQMK